jgi:hypothetical protein
MPSAKDIFSERQVCSQDLEIGILSVPKSLLWLANVCDDVNVSGTGCGFLTFMYSESDDLCIYV